MKTGQILYGLLLTSALCVGACSMDSPKTDTSEGLLAAEGQWALVEEKRSPDPVQANMETRAQVEPTQLSKAPAYPQGESADHTREDVHFRVLRLERQMKDVRADLDNLLASKPVIAEKPKSIEQVVKKAAQPKATPKAVKQAVGGPLRVLAVRTGEHTGKTRFVMDISNSAPKYSADIDNAEKLMVVELPGMGWEAAKTMTLKNSAFVKSYSVQPNDAGGSRLVIELKQPAKLTLNTAMKPNHVHGHRIVFDLTAP